jgi:hypothetical protein
MPFGDLAARPGLDDYGTGGDVKQKLKRRPLLVLFYMDGCMHCEANKPKWDEFTKKHPNIPVEEIESANVPSSERVNGFPTMKFKPRRGRERVISGQQQSASEIERKFGLINSLTRRRSRRRSRHVSRRRLDH